MFCSNCGNEIVTNVKFCPNCGKSTDGKSSFGIQLDTSGISESLSKNVNEIKVKAISSDVWLMAWAKAILPIHAVLGLILAVALFNGTNYENGSDNVVALKYFSVFVGAVSVFVFFVASGLKRYELWAWQANWAALVFIGIELSVMMAPNFIVGLILFIIWIVANRSYWASQKRIFK